MTAIERLCDLLDEHGVEHEGGEHSLRWRDRYGVMMQAFPLADGELGMEVWSCTPEQAVAATLGVDLKAENAKLREEFDKMDVWHSKELSAAMAEIDKLRELVRDYERCTMHADCAGCEYDGKLSTHCPLSPCFPDADELCELRIEVDE